MSSSRNKATAYEEHQAAWENLPWYVNGTLEEAELAVVEPHVANCVACRSEVKYLRQLVAMMQGTDERLPRPGPGLSVVMDRIERWEREGAGSPAAESGRRRVWTSWLQEPRRLRWAVAAQALVIVTLLAFTFIPGTTAPPETYGTLSDAAGVEPAPGPRLRVVFTDGVTERQIRELVRFVDGRIVDGPSAMGVYTLRLASSDGNQAELRALLEELRSSPQIQFAEPVIGGDR